MRKLLPSLAGLLLALSVTLFAQNGELPLPHSGTVFVLDADSHMHQIHSTEVVSNTHAGSNFAKAQVFAGSHSTVEIDKTTSALVLPAAPPALLIRVGDGDDADRLRSQIALLRLKPTKEHRVVLEMKQNAFGGHRTRKIDEIPTTKADAAEAGVVKLTPQQPLAPGEYAVVFLPKDTNFFAETVYDFTVGGK